MSAASAVPAMPAPAARIEPATLAPGARGQLTVTLDIPDGCHIQSHAPREPFLIPTVVEVDPLGDVTLGAPAYPAPVVDRFDWTPVELDVYRGRVDIVVPIEVGPAAADSARITGRVRYQGCTASACLPPVEHVIEATVEVSPTHR